MKTKFLSLSVVASFIFQSLSYAGERAPNIEFVRPLGMGGAFTAVADDHNIFNYNPAGMVQRTGGQFTLFELAAGASKDTKDALDFLDDNKDRLDKDFNTLPPAEQEALINDIANNISKLDPRIYVAGHVASYVSGPMPFHFGFGLFGVQDFSFRLDQGATVPNISFDSNADVILPVALAYRWDAFGGRLGAGVTGKVMRRFQIKQDRISVLALDTLDEPPIAEGKGMGLDVGFLYQPTERVNWGLVFQDAGGTKLSYAAEPAKNGFDGVEKHSGVIKTRTNVGVAVVPETLLWLLPTNDRWTFAFDLKDVFHEEEHVLFERGLKKIIGENFGTHAYLGAEYRWWFMRLRGGAYQGYPSFGLGLDIPILKIDYAFYGREIGYLAGTRRQDNHVVSLALRFGSGHTESRERIAKKKKVKKQREISVPVDAAPEALPPAQTEPQDGGNSQEQEIP